MGKNVWAPQLHLCGAGEEQGLLLQKHGRCGQVCSLLILDQTCAVASLRGHPPQVVPRESRPLRMCDTRACGSAALKTQRSLFCQEAHVS